MYEPYKQYLSALHESGKHRTLGSFCQAHEDSVLDFSTNDYLGLSKNSQVVAAVVKASQKYGVGSTGSRLLSGNSSLHETFEQVIAQDKQTETSLLFSSGFQANFSVLSSLLDKNLFRQTPIVFFDKLNHASLYQAIFLSKPKLYRYNHNNMQQLAALLDNYGNNTNPKFIVTETVFGMDGDIAPLEQLVNFSRQYNACLYLDEAHATGVFGKAGYGLSTTVELCDIPHIIMGTFSKALGCSGGYVACHRVVRDFLINRAPGFIYSTSPAPALLGGALTAWKMLSELESERTQLKNLGQLLREKLKSQGFQIGNSQTHIIPILLEKEARCLEAKQALLADGIIVSAIRPPTVPPNSARLRIALSTTHSQADIERLLTGLNKAIR